MKVLSGIQPTGRFHWGNYFGAIRQYIELQDNEQSFYFIADLHALTTVRDPKVLRQNVQDSALDLLALGLQPEKATLFRQSDVPEVTELTWLLLTITQMHLLEKCVAYKDKKAKGLPADAGLFTYPVLMAADILMYDSNVVPVGVDQVQHIEVTRDLAQRFNSLYGADCLVLPEAHVLDSSAKVPGTDGEKMSKSYGNTIPLLSSTKSKQIRHRLKIPRIRKPALSLICTGCSRRSHSRTSWPHVTVQAAWATAKQRPRCMKQRWIISATPLRNGPIWNNDRTTLRTFCSRVQNRPAERPARSWSAFARPAA